MTGAGGPGRERWAALVVRVFVDGDGDEASLRVHLSQSLDVAEDGRRLGVARSVDEVARTVQAWLEAFLEGGVMAR